MWQASLVREEASVRRVLSSVDKVLSTNSTHWQGWQLYQQLSPFVQTPRGRFLFLEAGGMVTLLTALQQSMTGQSEEDSKNEKTLAICQLLNLVCHDTECAVALGLLGGHRLIRQLLASSEDENDEEILEVGLKKD